MAISYRFKFTVSGFILDLKWQFWNDEKNYWLWKS